MRNSNRKLRLTSYAIFFFLCGHLIPAVSFANPDPIYVYLSGGGGAQLQQILNRVGNLRYLYERSSFGKLATVKYFHPDKEFTFLGQTYRWYSQTRKTEIVDYFVDNQGPHVHVLTSSMGGGIFRDELIADVIASSPSQSFQVGTITAIESMAPGLTRKLTSPDAFTFDLYVSIETTYSGLFAGIFKALAGAGPFNSNNCTDSSCFFYYL